jgi:murein DD-endopeptidase MepM/ murein hydrolase activator NlpD
MPRRLPEAPQTDTETPMSSTPASPSALRSRLRTPARPPRLRAVAALSFAALLTAATSLAGVQPDTSFSAAPTAAEAPDAQQLLTAAGTGPAVQRDAYGATTPDELAAAQRAERLAAAAVKAAQFGYRTASTFTNNPDSAVQWPFPVGVPISDGFGPRSSPGGIGSTNHKGVDFTPGQGTPINAVAAGVVRLVQSSDAGGLGVYIVIDHVVDGQDVSSWYGHMLTGSPVVSEGQVVLPGQQIGSVGNTGTSTGAHMHLEIHVGDTPVDPIPWLTARN